MAHTSWCEVYDPSGICTCGENERNLVLSSPLYAAVWAEKERLKQEVIRLESIIKQLIESKHA